MKTSSVILFFGLLVAASLFTSKASPVPDPAEPEQLGMTGSNAELGGPNGTYVPNELEVFGRSSAGGELIRMKRASCDLFSFDSAVFKPNHAVCAAHCIYLGNRGGECKGTVCHCRK